MNPSVLTVVTNSEPGDGHLVPRWVGGNSIATEPADGPTDELPVRRLVAGTLGKTISTELELDDVAARVLITNSRVAIVCRRFQAKGGGWVGMGGGAVIALVANLVSKARVAASGAGKAAVGQVRHEWISFVGWKAKTSGGSADEVRIGYRTPADPGSTTVLDLRIPADLDPALVAVEVLRRAARHRLAAGHAHDPETRRRCLELANGQAPPASSSGFAVVKLPAPETAPVRPVLQVQRPTPEIPMSESPTQRLPQYRPSESTTQRITLHRPSTGGGPR